MEVLPPLAPPSRSRSQPGCGVFISSRSTDFREGAEGPKKRLEIRRMAFMLGRLDERRGLKNSFEVWSLDWNAGCRGDCADAPMH